MGISKQKLSRETGIPMSRVNGIIQGTRGITADTALRLGRFLGMSPEFWLGLQASNDIDTTRKALGERLEREVRPLPHAE